MQINDVMLNVVEFFEKIIIGINTVLGMGLHAGSSGMSTIFAQLNLI